MRRRHHERELVVIDDDRVERGGVGTEGDHAEVGAVVEHLRRHAAAEGALHRDVHFRIEPPVLVQNRQQIQTRQLVGRHRQSAGPQLPHVVQGRHRALPQVDQALGVVGQHPPGVGQHAAPARAVEQRPADLVLELLDGLADGRLGAEQGLGGGRKAAFPHDREKGFELEQFHRNSIL